MTTDIHPNQIKIAPNFESLAGQLLHELGMENEVYTSPDGKLLTFMDSTTADNFLDLFLDFNP